MPEHRRHQDQGKPRVRSDGALPRHTTSHAALRDRILDPQDGVSHDRGGELRRLVTRTILALS